MLEALLSVAGKADGFPELFRVVEDRSSRPYAQSHFTIVPPIPNTGSFPDKDRPQIGVNPE
jgi:hypothetical protein